MKLFSIQFGLYASLLFLPLTIAAFMTPGHVLDADPLFLCAIPFGIVLGAFHARFHRHWKDTPARLPSWGTQLYYGFFNSILATVMFGTILRALNIGFDSSPPQSLRLSVLQQHIATGPRGRGSTLKVIVANPLQKGGRTALTVSEAFYIAHPVGSSFPVRLRRGRLGSAWIEPFE